MNKCSSKQNFSQSMSLFNPPFILAKPIMSGDVLNGRPSLVRSAWCTEHEGLVKTMSQYWLESCRTEWTLRLVSSFQSWRNKKEWSLRHFHWLQSPLLAVSACLFVCLSVLMIMMRMTVCVNWHAHRVSNRIKSRAQLSICGCVHWQALLSRRPCLSPKSSH